MVEYEIWAFVGNYESLQFVTNDKDYAFSCVNLSNEQAKEVGSLQMFYVVETTVN